jgi:hypothetical protein
MHLSREPFSKEIDESGLHVEKHDEQRSSIGRGIMIDLRPEPVNAFDAMRINRESFSNEIDESGVQFEKHDEKRIPTFRGIVIDLIGPL